MGSQPVLPVIRVLVADNNVIHTELLGQAIAKDRRVRVVELTSSAPEVRRGVQEASPDVVLISESLDQQATGGLELMSEMRHRRPGLKMILLTDSPTRETVVEAFRAGARGVFCRNQPLKMLCRCILVVYEGQIWASSAELSFLLDAVSATPALRLLDNDLLDVLSVRERAVTACLAEGLCNREIAVRLTISEHTVKNYMFRIFEKLGVSSRVELLSVIWNTTNYRKARPPQSEGAVTHFKNSASGMAD